jgi:metal-dependent amidase/aminoacylase/carboxypeptidase family protein
MEDRPTYDPRRRDREGVGVAQDVVPIQDAALAAIDRTRDDIERITREIFADPEPTNAAPSTAERLTRFLADRGFDIESPYAGVPSAFYAVREHYDPDKFTKGLQHGHVALIAEYDVDPAARQIYGRHLSTGVALAAAVGLNGALDRVFGRISVIGSPAGSKPALVQTGIFETTDVAFGARPTGGEGALATFNGSGERLAGIDGTSTFDSAADATAFIEVIERSRPDLQPHEVVVVAPGIDPASATIEVRAATLGRARELAEWLGARATDAGGHVSFAPEQPEMIVSRVMMRRVQSYTARVDLRTGLPRKAPPAAPDDWGVISQITPTADCLFSISEDAVAPGTPAFARAADGQYAYEQMLRLGAAITLAGVDVFADINFRVVADSELVRALGARGVTRAHRRWTGVRPYVRKPRANGTSPSSAD